MILVVDDEGEVAESHRLMLSELGHQARVLTDPTAVLQTVNTEPAIDLLLLDIKMPQMSGIEVLKQLRSARPEVGVILATVINDIESAIFAIKNGAYNYLLKPLNLSRLNEVISSYYTNRPPALSGDRRFQAVITASPLFTEIFHRTLRFAEAEVPVLIEGETGTGKELFARLIHALSPLRRGPFVAVNSSALPRELFEAELFGHTRGAFTGAVSSRGGFIEAASGGSLFLDEIGELALEEQKKLLRVLQEKSFHRVGDSIPKKVDARLIFATNRKLSEAVAEGSFREDLYYRLNGHVITLPPLRDRPEDIKLLSSYFVRKYAAQYGKAAQELSAEALAMLCAYRFPGNVRELEGILSSAVLIEDGSVVSPASLPSYLRQAPDASLEQIRYSSVVSALEASRGNQTRAAEQLGIARETLNRMIKRYRSEGRPVPGQTGVRM